MKDENVAGGGEVDCQELGDFLGLSRSRVRQIEMNAIEKMRALVFGTDDFPVLREALGGGEAAGLIEQDAARYGVVAARQKVTKARKKARCP